METIMLKVLLVLHQTTTSVDWALVLQGFRRVFQFEKHLPEAEEVV